MNGRRKRLQTRLALRRLAKHREREGDARGAEDIWRVLDDPDGVSVFMFIEEAEGKIDEGNVGSDTPWADAIERMFRLFIENWDDVYKIITDIIKLF